MPVAHVAMDEALGRMAHTIGLPDPSPSNFWSNITLSRQQKNERDLKKRIRLAKYSVMLSLESSVGPYDKSVSTIEACMKNFWLCIGIPIQY